MKFALLLILCLSPLLIKASLSDVPTAPGGQESLEYTIYKEVINK